MNFRIFDTATRELRDFEPLREGHASVYLCGATPQAMPHIGHVRSGVAFDILRRWLMAQGLDVAFVRNVTDIDDKILTKAAEHGRPWWEWVSTYEREFTWAYDQLGVLPPSVEPRATGHVTQMVEYMQRLIDNGYAYDVDGNVYFDVNAWASSEGGDYGSLSGNRVDEMEQGEPDSPGKRGPHDFALWKSAKPGEPSWPTPWGDGRPGWHLECSAMATYYLGGEFDIHCGGLDLQFPHHENEIAQSEGATGEPFVNVWMHNGFVRVNEEKMSKSLGNFFTVREILQRFRPEEVRYFILTSQYRSPLNYDDEHLEQARAALTRLYTALRGVPDLAPEAVDASVATPFVERFHAAMDDDFNTPEALAVLFDLVREVNRIRADDPGAAAGPAAVLRRLGGILGILQEDPELYLRGRADDGGMSDAQIESLVQARIAARAAKDWAEADRLRKLLSEAGIGLEDGPSGTAWRRGA